MRVALIITTYNWPQALELCLQSVVAQTKKPDEVIIADDGSDDKTRELITRLQKEVPLIHSWQEDRGFRLAASRNKAIAQAESDYIIVIDGDMILEKHFVQDHMKCAKQGIYLQGSRVLMSEQLSKAMISSKKMQVSWMQRGLGNRKNAFRFSWVSKLICQQENQRLKGIRGCNFSLFKSDIMAVNGFNEDFTRWGREDSEFVQRLYHAGVKRKNLKFRAVQYHIYHDEGKSSQKNDEILDKTIIKKLTWCDNGINKYIKGNE